MVYLLCGRMATNQGYSPGGVSDVREDGADSGVGSDSGRMRR